MTLPPPLGSLDMAVLAGDGLLLRGVLAYPELPVARNYPLAVLAHQYPATMDSYAPLIEDLLELGVAVLAFDERGHGASTAGPGGPVVIDAPVGFTGEAFGAAFMASAARVGFGRIDDDILRVASWGAAQNQIDTGRLLLVGSSVGGSGALLAAPAITGLVGVITFGAAGAPVFPDGPARIRRATETVKAPFLLTTSEGDPFNGAQNVRDWSRGLPHVGTRIVPGAAHAMAIYYDVRDEVLAFVRKTIGV
ncbi:MAG: alpha/beta fold hydrolase [Gemmatimonadota bacterium]|nr:alpha/beta fold hydrolase [Gemmatimonadota bacterium]MDH5284987.1 alpha/beta fold hydrolase [Gemmatimonadota bacterium]